MPTPGRASNGKFTRTIENAQRDAEAARLRARGKSYQQIADTLGYSSRADARRGVQLILVETVAEPAAEVREMQLVQLDELTQAALDVLERRHITVSHGRVIYDDDGTVIEDDGPVLAAIDRLLRIQERRAKLLGLDAPSRHEVVTLSAVEAEIERLSAELGRSEAGSATGAPPPSI